MPDLTPLEAAEKLEWIAKIAETDAYICTQDSIPFLKQAASLLRAIGAGEYKRVVRCYECRHWMLYRDPETGNPCLDGHCDHWHGDRRREGFCDCGERKDEDK